MFHHRVPAAALILSLLAAPAFASEPVCPQIAPENWMQIEAAEQIGRDLGYDVSFVQPDAGCWTVYGHDKDGAKIEVFLNPETGEVARIEYGS